MSRIAHMHGGYRQEDQISECYVTMNNIIGGISNHGIGIPPLHFGQGSMPLTVDLIPVQWPSIRCMSFVLQLIFYSSSEAFASLRILQSINTMHLGRPRENDHGINNANAVMT